MTPIPPIETIAVKNSSTTITYDYGHFPLHIDGVGTKQDATEETDFRLLFAVLLALFTSYAAMVLASSLIDYLH